MGPTNAQIKLTIAKLIEVAYSTDKGLTKKIVLSKGSFKLTVDEEGNAILSGRAGLLTFSGADTIRTMGLSVGPMNATFWREGSESRVHYAVGYGAKIGSASIGGSFDIEELITACSGWLCQAARSLKNFDANVDAQMQQIMGY